MDQKDPAPPLPGPGECVWPWLVALLLLTGGVRAVQAFRTETTTRDSISFARAAWKLRRLPLPDALRKTNQHPLYPLCLLAASQATSPFCHSLPFAVQLAGQLVGALASLALAVVMYYLGRELFSPAVGFWGALLYQFLPGPGRIMVDGLSEPVFLVFALLATLAAVRGLSGHRPLWFALAGLSAGLAYLTRPEGLLVPACCLLVLAWWQMRRGWEMTWAGCGYRAALLLAPLLAVSLPYMLTIKGLTVKPSADFFMHPEKWEQQGLFKPVPADQNAGAFAPALPFAVWNFNPHVGPDDRWGWAFYAVYASIDAAFFYGGLGFVLIGLLAFRRRAFSEPGWALVLLVPAVMLLLCYRVAQANGYLSARHLVLFTSVFTCAGVAGLAWCGAWLSAWLGRAWPQWGGLAAVLLIVIISLPKLLAPLHGNRAGFRQAGEWIAQNSLPGDRIWDPYAYAEYHAGRIFTEGEEGLPATQPDVTYFILEEGTGNPHTHLWYLVKHSEEMAKYGRAVKRFPLGGRKRRGEVVVYRVQYRLPELAGR